MMFIITSMITAAQKQYHLDIKTSLIKNEINLNDGKFHLLTEDMLKPFKTEITYKKSFVVKSNHSKMIKLNLQKVNIINYHFEKDFYYNPIIYKF